MFTRIPSASPFLCAVALFFTLLGSAAAQKATVQDGAVTASADAKKPYFWFRIWPDFLVKYDVEADKVVHKVQTLRGVCHDTNLTHDRKQFLLVTGKRTCIEVLDIAQGKIVGGHTFEEGGWIIRVSDVKEIPGGTHWYVKIDRIRRELDHYVVEKPEWLLYDIAEKRIDERMAELPEPIRRGARISPDGKMWHVFSNDITIVNPETLEEEGKIELSKPLYTGMGPISIRGEDFYDNLNPNAYKMIYTMRDPVKRNRSLTGTVEIDIAGRRIANLVEWGAALPTWRLRMTADRKVGFGQKSSRDRGSQSNGDDPIMTLISFDLTNGKKIEEGRIEVRNGLSFTAIAPDGSKVYLSGRGHELAIYDSHFEYIKTVEMDGELDGSIHVVWE